jgi:hypothetical protein
MTKRVNSVTKHTVGGVIPGAIALMLAVYFVLQLWPEPHTVRTVTSIPNRLRNPRALVRTAAPGRPGTVGGGGGRPGVPVPGGRPATSGGKRRKVGAVIVGLVLPSVVATIPGALGVAAMSAVNVIGGAFAWVVAQAFGLV